MQWPAVRQARRWQALGKVAVDLAEWDMLGTGESEKPRLTGHRSGRWRRGDWVYNAATANVRTAN